MCKVCCSACPNCPGATLVDRVSASIVAMCLRSCERARLSLPSPSTQYSHSQSMSVVRLSIVLSRAFPLWDALITQSNILRLVSRGRNSVRRDAHRSLGKLAIRFRISFSEGRRLIAVLSLGGRSQPSPANFLIILSATSN